jgi:Arc/MetJ-type ribon-helix-helix transcriptional regulator
MKLSVSLPADDIAFIDAYARRLGGDSRSSVLRRAIGLLRMADLESSYSAAWDEWATSGDAERWDATTGDGLADAAR